MRDIIKIGTFPKSFTISLTLINILLKKTFHFFFIIFFFASGDFLMRIDAQETTLFLISLILPNPRPKSSTRGDNSTLHAPMIG